MQTSTPFSPPLREPAAVARGGRAGTARAGWVDAAKGMGIVLVVVGHAIDGLLAAQLADPARGWAAAYVAIYSFHMPLFFLLAGLFVAPRLAADRTAFLHGALVRIAWPYLLWSVVQLAVIGALGSLVNTPSTLDSRRIVGLLWEPTSQFWFLQALLVLHLLGAGLLPRIGPVPFLALMLVARGVVAEVELPTLVGLPARFGVFYALGVVLGPRLLERLPMPTRRRALALAAGAAAAWAAAVVPVHLAGLSHWSLAAAPSALAGTAAVLALATLPRAASAWVALGRATMAIYVLHVLCVAGVRIGLHKGLGIDQPFVILALACAAGIAVPWLLHGVAQRAGWGRALGLG